jgi:hypothetical protein
MTAPVAVVVVVVVVAGESAMDDDATGVERAGCIRESW